MGIMGSGFNKKKIIGLPQLPISMKKLFSLFLISYSNFLAFAQIDVNNFGKLQFGIMYDRTNFTGLYTLANKATGEAFTNQTDYIHSLNAEI